MNRQQIIRAWKDEEYRSNLSEAERASLPEHPAGLIELSETETEQAGGATISSYCVILIGVSYLEGGTCKLLTFGCCGVDLP